MIFVFLIAYQGVHEIRRENPNIMALRSLVEFLLRYGLE